MTPGRKPPIVTSAPTPNKDLYVEGATLITTNKAEPAKITPTSVALPAAKFAQPDGSLVVPPGVKVNLGHGELPPRSPAATAIKASVVVEKSLSVLPPVLPIQEYHAQKAPPGPIVRAWAEGLNATAPPRSQLDFALHMEAGLEDLIAQLEA